MCQWCQAISLIVERQAKLRAFQDEPDRNRDCLRRLPPGYADLDLVATGEAICSKRAIQ